MWCRITICSTYLNKSWMKRRALICLAIGLFFIFLGIAVTVRLCRGCGGGNNICVCAYAHQLNIMEYVCTILLERTIDIDIYKFMSLILF